MLVHANYSLDKGGFGMAAHNYDGDMLTDEIAQVQFYFFNFIIVFIIIMSTT